MDISQYQTESNNALLEIQRAQRALDQTEHRLKRYKRQKQLSSNLKASHHYISSPLPDIKEYLSFLINDENIRQQNTEKRTIRKSQHIQQSRKKQFSEQKNLNYDHQPNFLRKREMGYKYKQEQIRNSNNINNELNFDLRKHTQQQLQKSQLIQLQKMERYYKQNEEMLNKKIQLLQQNYDKIKKDKVLLMRDNEELQEKIDLSRRNNELNCNQIDPLNQKVDKLNMEISKLQKRLAKIQIENSKIIKRKQDLEVNMRVCIRNSRQQLQTQLLKGSKSKSMISQRCPYH